MLASPCLAAQREAHNRGPSVTERRAVEAAAAEAEQERLAKRGTAPRVVSTALVLSSGNGAGEARFRRAQRKSKFPQLVVSTFLRA